MTAEGCNFTLRILVGPLISTSIPKTGQSTIVFYHPMVDRAKETSSSPCCCSHVGYDTDAKGAKPLDSPLTPIESISQYQFRGLRSR